MPSFSVKEYDEAGTLQTTYVHSQSRVSNRSSADDTVDVAPQKEHSAQKTIGGVQGGRVDVLVNESAVTSWGRRIMDVFLPSGYPHSVTEDYLGYQIYDSLQAFSSSIAGLISNRAVLEGVGVGDASASPTAALLLSILQESMGRIATILFAHRLGTSLEPECKMYRLAADIFNDTAMILDCCSPIFPKPLRVVILSFSSVLRALCGVAAGSSKASLSAHFARWGNLGELNAKDSSQETVISLLGMLAGSVVVSWVVTPLATWITLLLLLAIHLGTNYAAVRSVQMRSLNRQRANILFSNLIDTGVVLTPAAVSRRERIFEKDGVLRWGSNACLGYCEVGASLHQVLRASSRANPTSGAFQHVADDLEEWFGLFENHKHVLWYDDKSKKAIVLLKQGASTADQLRGWLHAMLMAKKLTAAREDAYHGRHETMMQKLRSTLETTMETFEASSLVAAGWDLETAALETRPGCRLEA